MMKRCLFAVLFTLGIVSTAKAQDLQVKSAASYNIFQAQNTSTVNEDRVAVKGLSLPSPNWGVGGQFEGGYTGIRGYAQVVGTGSRTGVLGYAGGGTYNYAVFGSASTAANNYAGFFSGNVYISGTLTQASDLKLKVNVHDLPDGTLAQVLKLRPKTYQYRTTTFPKLGLPEGDHVGLIAQDVAAVFPQAVKQVTAPNAPDDHSSAPETFLSVDYTKIIPLLVKAVQEQQAQIDALKATIAKLK